MDALPPSIAKCTASASDIAAALDGLRASIDRDATLTAGQRTAALLLIAGLARIVEDDATRERLRTAIVEAMRAAGV